MPQGPSLASTRSAPAPRRMTWLSWALMDAARTPYFVLVDIYIFAPYFTTVVIGDPVYGQAIWARKTAVAAALIAVLSPVLGAIADAGGRRKPWILASLAVATPAMSVLWLAQPHASMGDVFPTLAALVVASVGCELTTVFQNAMLPKIALKEQMGRLSGLAGGLGSLASVVVFAAFLALLLLPAHPMFGLRHEDFGPERVVGLLSAAWLIALSLPLLLFTPDSSGTGLGTVAAVRQGLRALGRTVREVRRHRNVARFLVARMAFNDGIVVILLFGGVYAGGLFRWNSTALTIYGMTLTAVAGVSSLLAGWIDDRIGSRRALILCLCGNIVVIAVSVFIIPGQVLFFSVASDPATGAFGTVAERAYLGMAVLGTLFVMMSLVSSRSLMGRLAPPTMSAEFFGLFAFSGTATAFLGPLAASILTHITHNQRAGFAVILIFLATGLLLLLRVHEEAAPEPMSAVTA